MINNFFPIGSLSRKSLQNSHLFAFSIKFGYFPNTSKNIIFSRFSNNSKFSTTKQRQYSQLQKKSNIDKGFLSLFTYYFVTNIDNDRLFKGKGNFDTIRERLLKQKHKFYIAKECGLDPKNVDQFFAAFEIGKGVTLDAKIFKQQRLLEGRTLNEKNSVFNITSVTQKVFKFATGQQNILVGNFGIGKTWSHACLNYLSSMVLKCIVCDKELNRMKQLINLYFDQFLEIHRLNNDDEEAVRINITRELLIQQFKTFPIELFIQLRTDLNWSSLVKNLHEQFPEIQLTKLKQLRPQKGQSDQNFKQRVYTYQKDWAQIFFANMSDKFSQYREAYYPEMKFVINVDQANIYFGSIREIISLLQEIQNLKMNDILSKQDKRLLDKKQKLLSKQQGIANKLQDILQVMMQKVRQYVKMNCSDQIKSNIVAQQASLLKYVGFINFFKHSFPNQKHINHGINLKTQVGLKEMWSILWFQFQRNIIGANKNNKKNPYISNFEGTLKQINLRQYFNQSFSKMSQQNEKFRLETFFARFYSLRMIFQNNQIVKEGLEKLLKLIHSYIKTKVQNKILQLSEQQRLRKQIYIEFQTFINNCFIQSTTMDIKITQARRKKGLSHNNREKQRKRKLFFLVKLRTLIKEKQELLIKNNNKKQLNEAKIVLSKADVEKLQSQIISALGNYSLDIINDLLNTQYMKYTNQRQLIILESFNDFFQRIDNIQLDDAFILQYIKWVCYSEQEYVNQSQFDRRMTFLLSKQSCKVLINKEKFNIVNNNITHWFTSYNCQNKRDVLRQNLRQILKALDAIRFNQALGFRPATKPSDKTLVVHSATNPDYNDIKYSKNSIWFDLILARKGEDKNQLISIDFSLSTNPSEIKKKIKKVTQEFYDQFIKNNYQFKTNFTYIHWLICRQQTKESLQSDKESFIKIMSVNDIEFESKKFGSEYRLRALCDLKRLKQENK